MSSIHLSRDPARIGSSFGDCENAEPNWSMCPIRSPICAGRRQDNIFAIRSTEGWGSQFYFVSCEWTRAASFLKIVFYGARQARKPIRGGSKLCGRNYSAHLNGATFNRSGILGYFGLARSVRLPGFSGGCGEERRGKKVRPAQSEHLIGIRWNPNDESRVFAYEGLVRG